MQQQTSIYFEVSKRKPTITPMATAGGGGGFGEMWIAVCWILAESCPSPHREEANTSLNTSLKNKNAKGQPSGYSQTILFNQAFLLKEQEAANQKLLWKTARRSFPKVLSTRLWLAALKISH